MASFVRFLPLSPTTRQPFNSDRSAPPDDNPDKTVTGTHTAGTSRPRVSGDTVSARCFRLRRHHSEITQRMAASVVIVDQRGLAITTTLLGLQDGLQRRGWCKRHGNNNDSFTPSTVRGIIERIRKVARAHQYSR